MTVSKVKEEFQNKLQQVDKEKTDAQYKLESTVSLLEQQASLAIGEVSSKLKESEMNKIAAEKTTERLTKELEESRRAASDSTGLPTELCWCDTVLGPFGWHFLPHHPWLTLLL